MGQDVQGRGNDKGLSPKDACSDIRRNKGPRGWRTESKRETELRREEQGWSMVRGIQG